VFTCATKVLRTKKKLGININQLRKLITNSLKIMERILWSFVIICLYNNSVLLADKSTKDVSTLVHALAQKKKENKKKRKRDS
jgi:hypothetical protein